MSKAWLLLLAALIGCATISYVSLSESDAPRPWMNKNMTPEERARTLLSIMNLDQKLSLLHGYSGSYVGNVPGIVELSIPALKMNDGPQGFRDAKAGTTTSFPSG